MFTRKAARRASACVPRRAGVVTFREGGRVVSSLVRTVSSDDAPVDRDIDPVDQQEPVEKVLRASDVHQGEIAPIARAIPSSARTPWMARACARSLTRTGRRSPTARP